MDSDGFGPIGTFVEFSWHSFETDGPLDDAAGQGDLARLLAAFELDPSLATGGDEEAVLAQQEAVAR